MNYRHAGEIWEGRKKLYVNLFAFAHKWTQNHWHNLFLPSHIFQHNVLLDINTKPKLNYRLTCLYTVCFCTWSVLSSAQRNESRSSRQWVNESKDSGLFLKPSALCWGKRAVGHCDNDRSLLWWTSVQSERVQSTQFHIHVHVIVFKECKCAQKYECVQIRSKKVKPVHIHSLKGHLYPQRLFVSSVLETVQDLGCVSKQKQTSWQFFMEGE